MSAIVKSAIACSAIADKIGSYRSKLITTLSDTGKFTKTNSGKSVGSGGGTFTDGLNTNTVYIPINCNDDGDTDFAAYSGANQNLLIANVTKHNGTVSITSGVSLRGTKVVGTGGSVGYISFDIYTAK